nr:hypothetical protein Iba_chr12bCG15440 [Ipomoea batatas]
METATASYAGKAPTATIDRELANRRTERDTPLGSAAAAERRRVLRQGYPPNYSATDEHCCFVWPGEESKSDAATNHVTTKQRRREKPPPFKTSRCIATWSTLKVEAAAALASSHVAGKTGNTPVGVPRCRRLGAALTAAHLHSLFRRQRCRLLQEEIATGCSSSVLAALTEWRRNSRRSVLLPLLLRCGGNRRTERDTPLGSAAAAERRRVLRQGYPPNCSATDEHCCFVWPGEESKADAATNHVTTKQRRREKPPPFKTSRCIATWSTSKVEAAAALASSHVAGKTGNTPVGVPRCRRLGAALTAAHLHSLFRRQRCRLLQEEIATGCLSSVPAALTEWRRNSRHSVLLPLLLRCGGNRGRKSRSADAKLAGKIGEYARRSPAFGCCCVAKEIEGRSLSTEESADHPLCVAARNVAQRKRPKPPVSRLSAERRRMAEVLRPSRKEEPDHIAKLMPARRVGVDGVLPTVVARYSLPSPEKKPQPKTIGELLGEVHPCRAGAPPRLFMATAGAPPRL